VRAVDAAGNSADVRTSATTGTANNTCTAVPPAITTVTAQIVSSSQINLSWSTVAPPANCTITYNVFRSTTSGFTPSSANQIASGLTTTSRNDTGLAASTTYFYAVQAVDAAGSGPVGRVSGTTLPGSGNTLTVTKAGAGSGIVTSSPAGVSCGSTCSASFASGTTVTLTATPAAGSVFAGWGGACSGTAACTATMNQARSVTATFNTVPVGGGCHVVYALVNSWPGGFQGGLTIQNTGGSAWTNWTLTFTLPTGQVTQLWNGVATQSGQTVTVNSLGYNGSVPAGGSASGIGFLGSFSGSTPPTPTGFSVNGVTCN